MRKVWLVILLSLPLSGCYESSDVVIHKAGKYKGKSDSERIMHPTEEQHEVLSARLHAIQTDR